MRALDQLESKLIPPPKIPGIHAFLPRESGWTFCSLDERTLKKVSLTGGTPRTLCEVRMYSRGVSWGQDGTIVFRQLPGLWRISEVGDTPEELTRLNVFFPRFYLGVRPWY